MDNINLYQKAYNSEYKKGTNAIKDLLINYYNQHRPYIYASNSISNDISELKDKLYLNKEKLKNLTYIFGKRFEYFRDDYALQVIDKNIHPEFVKINDIKKSYSFERFIKELATFNALTDLIITFRNNSALYELMYKLNRFEKFEIEIYNRRIYGLPLYKEYQSIVYPNNETETTQIINFKIKEKYKERFKECYHMLINDYIDAKKTTYQNFCDVFLKDSGHTSKIFFFCTTISASYLLREISRNKIFSNLTLTNIQKSELFITSENRPLKQTNISNSYKKATEEDHKYVANLIESVKI